MKDTSQQRHAITQSQGHDVSFVVMLWHKMGFVEGYGHPERSMAFETEGNNAGWVDKRLLVVQFIENMED